MYLYIRKIIVFCVVCLCLPFVNAARSRYVQPQQPDVWLRFDSAIFSPFFVDTIQFQSDYTMMMVCKSLQPDSNQQLYKIKREDSIFYSIGTHGFSTERASFVEFNFHDFSRPCIYTVMQGLGIDTSYHGSYQLISGADSMNDSSLISLYEIAYFPKTLNSRQSLMFQTYLALKYGITLDHTNYISTSGNILWDARKDREFYHHIKGVGSDSVYKWIALSSSSIEDSVLSLISLDTLPVNSYALIGDDNGDLKWYHYQNDTTLLQRTWKMNTNTHENLQIKLNKISINSIDTPVLVILDNELIIQQTIIADSIDDNYFYYTLRNIQESSLLSFITTDVRQHYNKPNNINDYMIDEEKQHISIVSDLHGNYSLDILLDQESDIDLIVYDPSGKIIAKQSLTSIKSYQYIGHISQQGIYIISVYDKSGNLLKSLDFFVD